MKLDSREWKECNSRDASHPERAIEVHPAIERCAEAWLRLQDTWESATFEAFGGSDPGRSYPTPEVQELGENAAVPACSEIRLVMWDEMAHENVYNAYRRHFDTFSPCS